MKTVVFTLAAALLPSTLVLAGNHHMSSQQTMQMNSPSAKDPPIILTINPEGRVSAALGGRLPTPAPCGTAGDFTVKIVNQGFVTGVLEAKPVGDTPVGANIDFHPEPLSGAPEELRKLSITLTKPGRADVTIAFKPRNDFADLGNRDRIHFIMRCK